MGFLGLRRLVLAAVAGAGRGTSRQARCPESRNRRCPLYAKLSSFPRAR
jgi:hypothetical protein